MSKFLHLMSATAVTHSATARMLIVADAVTALITMQYKARFNRPRPTQVVPDSCRPSSTVGTHHTRVVTTQAHVFAALLTEVIPSSLGDPTSDGGTTIAKSLDVIAKRIARNRELAGLHYPSDTAAGITLAQAITDKILLNGYLPRFTQLVNGARDEFSARPSRPRD